MSVARTVIGPLTTTFTPAASCSLATVIPAQLSEGLFRAFGAQQCDNRARQIYDATDCYPPASEGAPQPNAPFTGWGFYSPGTICPSGYTSACTAVADGASQWSVQYTMTAGETAVGCCPSSYACANWDDPPRQQSCVRTLGAPDSFAVKTCTNGVLTGPNTETLPYTTSWTTDESVTTGAVSTYELWNPMIEIRWRAADLPSSTSAPVNNSIPETSPDTQSGLATGAKAGIGVGVGVGTLVLLGAAIWFWRRSRKSKGAGLGTKAEYGAVAQNGRYFEQDQMYQHTGRGDPDVASKGPAELRANTRYELPGRSAELGY